MKGEITVTENNQDVVILKSDGIPTYHFAHAVDDHLMRTNLVIRGEEWLASLPIHIELFKALGFRLPEYGHNCSIQKMDGDTRRKLSKRKDPEASLTFYREEGYHPLAVRTYMMTLLNSNFEEWRLKFPDKPLDEFKFSIGKMGKSGALFDILKLNDVSKTVLSGLSETEMFDFLKDWGGTLRFRCGKEAFFRSGIYAESPFPLHGHRRQKAPQGFRFGKTGGFHAFLFLRRYLCARIRFPLFAGNRPIGSGRLQGLL